jgi:hypothetical protein
MAVTRGWRVYLWLSVLWTTTALAQPVAVEPSNPARSFALDYTSHAGCPNAAALVDAIVARSAGAMSVAPEAAVVRLKVVLLAEGRSTLWVDLQEGSFRREFNAPSCDEAVATIAVIASMVLEAEPAARRAMAESVPAAPAEAAPDSAPPQPTPDAAPVPPPPVVRTPARRPRRLAPPTAPRPRELDRLLWAIAAGGALETAVAPTPPFGVVVGIDSWLSRASVWSPSLRVAFFATATATEHTDAGDGKFRLLAGQLHVCPLRLAASRSLRFSPCVTFEAGSLQAEGAGATRNALTPKMLWLTGGALLRAQLDVAGPLSVEATAGGKVLSQHDEFVLRPGSLVYQVPGLSAGFGLGLSWRFR